MVLNNINVARYRAGKEPYQDVADMKERIGIGKTHEDYEEIIKECEIILKKYGQNFNSATIMVK